VSARDYAGPACPHCKAPLLVETMAAGPQRCIACLRTFEATPLSPPEKRVAVLELAQAGPGGAVPCAQHPGNAADANCGRCGVFMCGLCKLQIDGQELCPACFDRLAAEGALPSARGRVRNYRGIALLVGFAGCWFYFLGLLTGPLTLYFAVQAQRQRRRLQESDGLGTVVLASLLGLGQIATSIFLLGVLVSSVAKGGS
jgi:hypothetical protein